MLAPFSTVHPSTKDSRFLQNMMTGGWENRWYRTYVLEDKQRVVKDFKTYADRKRWTDKLHFALYPFLDSHESERWFRKSQPTDWDDIARIRTPFAVPEIGGSRGALTKLVRQMPISFLTCWHVAGFIASSIPDVRIQVGLYPMVLRIQKSISTKDRRHLAYHEKLTKRTHEEIQGNKTNALFSGHKWIENKWSHTTRTLEDQPIFIDKNGLPWTLHVWNSYKGQHFDALCRTLFRARWRLWPNWYSKRHNRWLHWVEYKRIEQIDFSSTVTTSGFTDATVDSYRTSRIRAMMSSCIEHVNTLNKWYEHMERHGYTFEHPNAPKLLGFRLPQNRHWMKIMKPYPTP
jgi:hypothetical protein